MKDDPNYVSKIEYLYRRERRLRRMKEFEGGTRVGLSVTIIFDDEEKKLLIKPINAPHLPSMYTYTTDDIMCFKELGAIGVRIILSNSSRIELYFPDLYYRNEISRRIQNLIDQEPLS